MDKRKLPHSEEHRKRISLSLKGKHHAGTFKKGHTLGFKKGLIPWNKGLKGFRKGWKQTEESKERLRIANIGKKHSEETKLKIKEKRAKQIMQKGYKRPDMAGENSPSKRPEVRKKISEGKAKLKGWVTRQPGYFGWLERKRELRKKSNGGSHTFGDWLTLKAQYNFTCPCCKKSEPEIKLTEDHIIPISKGGSDNIENIQPLCSLCNSKKLTKIVKYSMA